MTAEIFTEQRKIKFRFFALYAASVALILFLFIWLSKKDETPVITSAATTYVSPTDDELTKADEFLHNKMDALNKMYSNVVLASDKTDNKETIRVAETAFSTSLDSLEKKALLLADEQQKQRWMIVLTSFKNNFFGRSSLLASYTEAKNTIANQPAKVQNNNEADELRRLLSEKEKTIAALQVRVNENTSSITKSSGDGEWKKRYAQVKNSESKLTAENGQLKKAYQIIIQDNQRLLAKIQTMNK